MTMKHIKIFIAVCDTGSMTAASKELYIAQPAVSFAIAEMENYYGQKLFDRISNRLHITEAGRHFLQYSRQIVSLFDEMEHEIKSWDSAGTLRIGSNMTLGTTLLPGLTEAFKDSHPGVVIQALVNHSRLLEDMLIDNKLDLALIEGLPDSRLLSYQKFSDNAMLFVCSPSHKWAEKTVNAGMLNHCDFIMREKESSERKILDEFLQIRKINVNIVWQSLSQQAILEAVEKNLGVACLSSALCERAISKGRVLPFYVEDFVLKREFYIVYHQHKFLTNLMQDFMDLCLEYL